MTITAIELVEDVYQGRGQLSIYFEDRVMEVWDEGQQCCEHRWMHTDDDLTAFIGAEFRSAHIDDGPTENLDYEVKESQFLVVRTSLGVFTVVNYNEHNGYYGGFDLQARVIPLEFHA